MKKLIMPHDRAFKAALRDRRVAQDFFYHHLPKDLQQQLNLDSLKIQNGSFIDQKLKTTSADILYRVARRNIAENAYLYLLLEAQHAPINGCPSDY